MTSVAGATRERRAGPNGADDNYGCQRRMPYLHLQKTQDDGVLVHRGEGDRALGPCLVGAPLSLQTLSFPEPRPNRHSRWYRETHRRLCHGHTHVRRPFATQFSCPPQGWHWNANEAEIAMSPKIIAAPALPRPAPLLCNPKASSTQPIHTSAAATRCPILLFSNFFSFASTLN